MEPITLCLAQIFVGIDVSKAKLDACLLTSAGKTHHKSFANTPQGFAQLLAWALALAGEQTCHFALEVTSSYSEGIALFLAEKEQRVSVLNPARVRYAALACGAGNKTDKADAKVIADASAAPWPQAEPTTVAATLAGVEETGRPGPTPRRPDRDGAPGEEPLRAGLCR